MPVSRYHSQSHSSAAGRGAAISYPVYPWKRYYCFDSAGDDTFRPSAKRRKPPAPLWEDEWVCPMNAELGVTACVNTLSSARPWEEFDVPVMSRDEIERCSPSRKDGIDRYMETRLRYSYCAFLQNLGMRLDLPQTTVGTAMVLCHRFFLRRSHASHDRFLIATAALFLAAKSEETPCLLDSVLSASCEICQKQNFSFFPHLLYPNLFELCRERIVEAEQLILTTLNFELEVEHPYVSLTSVLNKLGLSQTALLNLAWNLVNEGSGKSSIEASLFPTMVDTSGKNDLLRYGSLFPFNEAVLPSFASLTLFSGVPYLVAVSESTIWTNASVSRQDPSVLLNEGQRKKKEYHCFGAHFGCSLSLVTLPQERRASLPSSSTST